MRPRDRAALILVAIAVAWSCLAVGGAPRWAAVIAAALGLASAIPYVTSRRTSSRPSPMLLPLALMAALTALQLLPLPEGLAEQLAPAKLALVRGNHAAWGDEAPTWVMASMDPPATLVELAKLLGYLALAWTCVRLAAERGTRRWLVTIGAGTAVAAAVVTLAHRFLDLHELYGLYRPSMRLHIMGPLIGVNHLASLLTFAVPLAIALAVRARGAVRVGWGAAAFALVGVALLTGSRGGMLGLVVGLIVVATVLAVQRRAGDDSGRHVPISVSVPAVALLIAAVALLGTVTADTAMREIAETSLDEIHQPEGKAQLWVRTASLSAEHRWLGVGKGAFEAAYTPRAATGAVSYSHAENGYLQALIDWGVPGAAALLLLLGAAALAAARRWRAGPLEAGAMAALATLAVHEIADFSIEMPGVAMTAIAASSILWPARIANLGKGAERARTAPRNLVLTRVAVIAAAAVIVALAASPLGRGAEADAAEVLAAPPAERLAAARHAMERHPADHVLAGRAAEALLHRGDRRALDVIARALARSSQHAGLRRLAGRILSRTDHPEQAAVEFAAASNLVVNARPIVDDVLVVFRTPEAIASALSTEPRQAWHITARLHERKRDDAALAYAVRVAELHPHSPVAQANLADIALTAGKPEIAAAAADAAYRALPLARHAAYLGRALLALGEYDRGIARLHAALERPTPDGPAERINLTAVLVELHAARGDLASAKATLERARDLARDDLRWLVRIHERMARLEDALGNPQQAAWERGEAARLSRDLQ